VSINYYFSSNSFFSIDNEFIIENTKKLILQEKKNNMNFFSKIINNIFKPKNDLYEQITNIKTDFENSETQLDSNSLKENKSTEIDENERDLISNDFDSKEEYRKSKQVKEVKEAKEEKEKKIKIIKSLCNLVFVKDKICKFSSGFFIKLNFNDKQKFFLMTCEHMIDSQMINQNETIQIRYSQNKISNNIKLNKNERIIQDFIFLNIDATIVEIIEKDIIKEVYFLSPCMIDLNECKNKEIFMPNYINQKLYKNDGLLLSYNPSSYKFYNTLNANYGSSGSPIILKDTEYVIGLHTGKNKVKNFNIANFIYPIVSILSNGNPFYEIRKNGNLEYEGEMKNNKRDGYGKINLENGMYYIGQWKNGFKHGKGTLYYKNNSILYQGEFEDDKYNGEGKLIDDDGSYYIGQFKDGFKKGLGKFYNKNSILIYDGNFENGMFNGLGKYIEDNEKFYIGQWSNNKKDVGIEVNEKDKTQTFINNNNNSQKYLYLDDDNYYLEL